MIGARANPCLSSIRHVLASFHLQCIVGRVCSYIGLEITWVFYLMHGPVPKFSLQDTG